MIAEMLFKQLKDVLEKQKGFIFHFASREVENMLNFECNLGATLFCIHAVKMTTACSVNL